MSLKTKNRVHRFMCVMRRDMKPTSHHRYHATLAHYQSPIALALALLFAMAPLESAAEIALHPTEAAEEEIILDELIVTATRTR